MRLPVSILLLAALFMTGCAHEGVIVQKESRPHPLYHSVGIEGIYAFVLRDNAGAVHRQMVTPEVFERYAEGDYFNDLQPGPTRREMSDAKTMRTAVRPVATSPRMASRTKATKSRPVASKSQKARKAVAKRAGSQARKRKSQQVQRSSRSTPKVAAAAATKKKAAAVTPAESKSAELTAPTAKAAAAPTQSSSPEVTTPTMKTSPAATPVLPVTGGAIPDEPEIIFIPPRVR